MTAVSDPAAAPATVRTTRASDVAVALLLIAAELVLGWFTYDIGSALVEHLGTSRPVQWLYLMLPFLLLAVVVALHAVRPRRAVTAGLVALGAGAVHIGQYEVTRWLFTDRTEVSYDLFQAIGYASVMASATLAALAWGLSRRHGRAWPVGVLLAPAGAALTVWTNWPAHVGWTRFASVADTTGIRRAELVTTVALMLPVVAACVLCWLVDVAESRRDVAHQSYDEGPPPR